MDTRTWTDEQLRDAVASSRSWRGVGRTLGLKGTSASVLRSVKRHVQRLELSQAAGGRAVIATCSDTRGSWHVRAFVMCDLEDVGERVAHHRSSIAVRISSGASRNSTAAAASLTTMRGVTE